MQRLQDAPRNLPASCSTVTDVISPNSYFGILKAFATSALYEKKSLIMPCTNSYTSLYNPMNNFNHSYNTIKYLPIHCYTFRKYNAIKHDKQTFMQLNFGYNYL